MFRSISTIKADAARRYYDSLGEGITWAVLSSGIDVDHPHFRTHNTLRGEVARLHRDFTQSGAVKRGDALKDAFGHGTHVAGIIAGGLPNDLPDSRIRVFESFRPSVSEEPVPRPLPVGAELLSGMAPQCKLVSLKVLDDKGDGSSSTVTRALQYIRRDINGNGRLLRIQGVNISLGYEPDVREFACGQSPICVEVDQLVRSGVVIVVASGNTGYGSLTALARQTNIGFTMTINDPGNAELGITVGSTHRDQPHRYGVSYFSSKGPTLDGRDKPDLVAPGERIASCCAGRYRNWLVEKNGAEFSASDAVYAEDSGTSQAAAHVSGAIAAFLSVHREFIGRPDEVKRIFLESATSLGRRTEFQGHGLIDLMRALQTV